MQTKPLGNSDLHITPIGFGAWAIGGRNAKQVEGIVGAADFRLNEQELSELDTFLHENP